MKKEKLVQIYQLVDPRNGEVFYVGQTKNPENRLKEHIKDAIDTEKRIKIKEILSNDTAPEMIVIAKVPEHVANDYEKLLIGITKGLTNKHHNADRDGGSLTGNGEKVHIADESINSLCDAIAAHYVITDSRRDFVTAEDAYKTLARYCDAANTTAEKMLIGRAMAALNVPRRKRRVNGKRRSIYECLIPK